MSRSAAPWQRANVVEDYLHGIRAGIPLASEQLELMARIIAARSPQPRRILDVGAGDGLLADLLLDRFPGTNATAVDYSPPMLAAAEQRLARHGDAATLAAADVSDPAWLEALAGPAAFDVIVSGYCIHHLADARKRDLYTELYELLVPGGVFLNLEHVESSDERMAELNEELLIESIEAVSDDPVAARARYLGREDRDANILAPATLQCSWLEAIGFESVDVFFKWMEFALFGGLRPR